MRKGRNGIEQKIDHSKASNSVMFCGNAAGEILPPMVVYEAMFLNDGWASLNGAIYHSTDSGWFDERTFKRWFKEVFVLNLNGDGTLATKGKSFKRYTSQAVFSAGFETPVE